VWASNTPKKRSSQAQLGDPLISVAEAGRRLGLHRNTILRLIAQGRIPALRLTGTTKSHFRIRPEAVEAFVREGEEAIRRETE
jgi:excisionase family DNA binding protein